MAEVWPRFNLLRKLLNNLATGCNPYFGLGCQVVLSRGGYTSAIDLWSLGCIFGELLQRVAGLGAASTPQLQVAPMFAIQGKPKTPSEGYAEHQAPTSVLAHNGSHWLCKLNM